MSRGLNKVMLLGQLGREPEMRYTSSGMPVTSFSVATNRTWMTSSGEQRETTDWFNVVAWHDLAEICHACLYKGCSVYIEGRLQTRNWETETGQHLYRTEVVAEDMIQLSHK